MTTKMKTIENNTPETDGEWNRLVCQDQHEFERNLADFARSMERERDEALKAAEHVKAYKHVLKLDNQKLRRERDIAVASNSTTKNKTMKTTSLPQSVTTPEFKPFPKMPRLTRECLVTEKIDGTNASIFITEDGQMLIGSRNRWITPESDNFGFARWAMEHREELLHLGPGHHFGEWWGQGIQRGYGMTEKRFSLFNVARWCLHGEPAMTITTADPSIVKVKDMLPRCCHLVPVLYRGEFCTVEVDFAMDDLYQKGSIAAPGFKSPEGVIVFHVAGNQGFKKTFEGDEHKGNQ